ncbi:MAG: hypothetical protein LBQ66_15445 [Planctomycetaceae bacterium]|nr:hypothetical protein [Planctomycetaceae bacterium]
MITGTVNFDDGTPVNFGGVVFQNDTNTYTAQINKDGRYQTRDETYRGLPDGVYKVWINGSKVVTPTKERGQLPVTTYRLPKEYRSASESNLSFEVKSGKETTYNIVIKKATSAESE